MKKICYLFKDGRKKRLNSHNPFPREFYYGYFGLKDEGWDVDIIEQSDIIAKEASLLFKLFSIIFEKLFLLVGLNFTLFRSLSRKKVCNQLNSYDVIIATTNSFGLALALLKRLRVIRSKILFIVMGLIDHDTAILKKFFYKLFIKDVILCSLGEKEADFLSRFFSHKPAIYYIPFSVDTEFWNADGAEGHMQQPYFISIGNDRHRDYRTLVETWKPEFPLLKIITQQTVFNNQRACSGNVEVLRGHWAGGGFSDNEIKRLIQQSSGVIVPLEETIQPSGQSICLQAMVCAKPLILTATSGIWSEKHLKHMDNCYLVPPRNPQQLTVAVKWVLENQSEAKRMGQRGRQTVLDYFSIEHFDEKLYLTLVNVT